MWNGYMSYKRFLLKLFTLTFTLSAFTFGGGYVIVSFMKDKFADKLGWVAPEDVADIVSVAQAAPGVVAINSSIMLGFLCGKLRLSHITGGRAEGSTFKGIVSSVVCILGAVLPPFLTMLAVSSVYNIIKENKYVRGAFWGMSGAICAIIASVVIDLIHEMLKQNPGDKSVILTRVIPLASMAIAAILIIFFGIGVQWLVLAAIAFGLIMYFILRRKT